MEYIKHIVKAINYIEENLQQDINLAACANISGYSQYHFLRLFKYVTGLTPADYIRKRRISEIAKAMINNDEYISELAFQYGFNSKENFIRAFKSEHHILPTEYKAAENSLKLYEKITFENIDLTITPSFVTLNSFELTTYKSDGAYTPNFWNKYNAKGQAEIITATKALAKAHLSGEEWCENAQGLAAYPRLIDMFESEDTTLATCFNMEYALGTFGALKWYAWKFFEKYGEIKLAALYKTVYECWQKAFELKKAADLSVAENRKTVAVLMKTAYECEKEAIQLM